MRKFSNVLDYKKKKFHGLFSPQNHIIYENVEKYVQPDRPQMTIHQEHALCTLDN